MDIKIKYKIDEKLWNNFKKINEESITLNYHTIPPNKKLENEVDDIYDYCTACEEFGINIEESQRVCLKCGIIDGTVIDSTAEWRYYGSEDNKLSDPTRCGLPTNELLPESSLGSVVSYSYNESYDMKKIRNYHAWNAMPYKERSLYNVFDNIKVRAVNSGIPLCIIEEANILYKKISETRISRGSNRKGIIASCIYKACKIKNVPRSAKEIADMFHLTVTNMTKGCKKFDEIMNINNKSERVCLTTSASDSFVNRFCSRLNINSNIVNICEIVCVNADKFGLVSENTPPSVAAGTIYLVCSLLNLHVTKKDISNSCKISEVTISKCYKKLFKYHKHLLPPQILKELYG